MQKATVGRRAVAVWLLAGTILLSGGLMRRSTDAATRQEPPAASQPTTAEGTTQVAVTFTGGYATDPQDRGRPVVLIAAALNVPAETFRKAFSEVRPAAAGKQPEPAQVRQNKEALLKVLEPLGVTNERLDEVSNYYRYNRGKGEMWRNTPAAAVANVRNGVVTGFTITNGGAGYSSAPEVSIPSMPNVKLAATVSFGTDLAKNGSIKEIKVAETPRTP